ncbi:MAG: phosphate acyltransferase PlsX [Nitrospinota bacterium]|nr:phosphate acyltransferase PlsX [Nitrospinota bacterium]
MTAEEGASAPPDDRAKERDLAKTRPKTAPKPEGERIVRIALDAMGGDYAPAAIVEGAIQAARDFADVRITLVGIEDVVKEEMARHGASPETISIAHAEEVIAMDEQPAAAMRRKKNSSIHVGIKMVRDGEADAFISAGNTGAVMAVATVLLRTIDLIDRPAIAATMPSQRGYTVLLDAGANVVCKPENLFQFGIMGSIFAEHSLDKPRPTVGLLSIGEEDVKGNPTTKEAFDLFSQSSLNFIGNIEAKLFYRGIVDVVVCDGFTGNIALKISESVAEMITVFLKQMFSASLSSKIAYFLMKSHLADFKRKVDHQEVGGAPLLGVNGPVFISHGSSSPKSIKSAIIRARKFVQEDVIEHIRENLAENKDILAHKEAKEEGIWTQLTKKIGFGQTGQESKDE